MTAAVLLLWTVTVLVPAPCPDYQPSPYTGEYPAMHCAVLHQKVEARAMRRQFNSEAEADEFIKNAPKDIEFKKVIL